MTRRGLALLGGPPAFAEALHVGRPNIGDRAALHARLDEILDRRWLTNRGPVIQAFEREVAEIVGVRHCITTSSATVALEIAIRAAGLSGEVIVPAFTYVSTAHALAWQGLTPVFADIDPATHNLDPAAVERAITPRTTGIIGVHVWGRACAVDDLEELARARGLVLLFDAAHALGCTHGGRKIGGFGRAEVFSFHATKVVNTFEGGAITTDDDDLARSIRLMINLGFAGPDDVACVGTNGKLSEVAAAMGLCSLAAMDGFVAINRANHAAYGRALAGIPGLALAGYDPAEAHNHHWVVVEVDGARAGVGRDDLVDVLHAENVLARRYFFPGCHRMAPYRALHPDAVDGLPHTDRLCGRVMQLPTGTGVTEGDIAVIGDILRSAVERGDEVRRAGRRRNAGTGGPRP